MTSAEKTILANPGFETALEVLFVLAASWIPIFWGAFTSGESVSGYLNKGEITLLVIGLCGSIFFILSLRGFPINVWIRSAITLVVTFIIFFPSASAIGKNPNFKNTISDSEFDYFVGIYFLAIAIYYYCSWRSKLTDLPSPEATAKSETERAQAMIKDAKNRRG